MAETEKIEIWKQIPQYEGLYDISSDGRVRSWLGNNNQFTNIKLQEPRILKQANNNGYLFVSLLRKQNYHRKYVHRLVLEAFIGPPTKNCEGAHLDGDKSNNRLDNLEWKTSYDNCQDKVRHGTLLSNEDSPQAKLTNKQVIDIRLGYARGELSYAEIGLKYNIAQTTVYRIVSAKGWKQHYGLDWEYYFVQILKDLEENSIDNKACVIVDNSKIIGCGISKVINSIVISNEIDGLSNCRYKPKKGTCYISEFPSDTHLVYLWNHNIKHIAIVSNSFTFDLINDNQLVNLLKSSGLTTLHLSEDNVNSRRICKARDISVKELIFNN